MSFLHPPSSSGTSRVLLAACLGLASVASIHAETFTWDFSTATPAGTVPNLNVPTVTQYSNNGTTPLLSTTSASSGYAGATGTNNAGAAARIGDLNTAPDGSAAFEFTLQPSSGFQFTLSGIQFGNRRTGTGPQSYSLRSSADNYASDIVSGAMGASGSWTLISHSGLTFTSSVPVTFRLFGHSGTGSPATGTANWRIDDLALTVTTSTSSSDTTPPTVSNLTPADGATNVVISTPLEIRFSEGIQAATGAVNIYKTDGTLAQSIAVPSSAVTISGFAATITPAALDYATGYYVQVTPGAFTDLASNAFAGIADNSTWNFTTIAKDVTPPSVTALSPLNGATNIAPPTQLVMTFSETIQQYLGSDLYYITVRDSLGAEVTRVDAGLFAVAVSTSGSVATIPLTTPLDYGKSYYVEVDAGAFTDGSGNPNSAITGNSTWAFSTIDVPGLTTTPYTQTFATYNSTATLPSGWSFSGAPGFIADYQGDWGTVTTDPTNPSATLGGFKGNASVFGYSHSSITGTTQTPLLQTLTLRNNTGAEITALTVSYKGRVAVPANTRIPAYTVTVGGTAAPALSYATSDGDNTQRNAAVSGLSIPVGATFQISWSSVYPTGAGSARQIGISDVVVSAGSTLFSPTVASMNVPVGSIGGTIASAEANVIGDGGQTLTGRGFVYSISSANANPEIGGSGVTQLADAAATTGSFSASLSSLSPGTQYSIRGYATNASGTSYTTTVTFTTLAAPPTLVSSYTQNFVNYDGTNPAGWTAVSAGNVQGFVGAWGTTSSSGGFLGSESDPGVLGYRHTGSTVSLAVTLRMINGTGATLNSLYVSYLGRVHVSATTPEGRSPIWTFRLNGAEIEGSPLNYSTETSVDATKATLLTGLSIAPGAEFTLSWTSDRGLAAGSSKQIGLSRVYVGLTAPAGYDSWAATNAGGQTSNLDFDGDGIDNGAEYFMGTAGNAFTANPGVVAGKVTWPRAAGTTISSFKVEVSENMSTWQDATVNYASNLSITSDQVIFTMPSTPTKLFVRLSVTP